MLPSYHLVDFPCMGRPGRGYRRVLPFCKFGFYWFGSLSDSIPLVALPPVIPGLRAPSPRVDSPPFFLLLMANKVASMEIDI